MPMPGGDSSPATEAVLTMWASSSWDSMSGTKLRSPWITP
jgi:hypothetical protein